MSIKTNILLETGTNELEIVEFIINFEEGGVARSQSFAINVAKVREIIKLPDLTKMPRMPQSLKGVFNLRGQIISAFDLRHFLYNQPNNELTAKLIISEFNKIKVGFIVNDVRRIHRISWKEIVSPDTLHDFDPEYSTTVGLIRIEDRQVLMLDVEKILAEIDPASAIDNTQSSITFTDKPIVLTVEDSVVIRKMITDRLNKAGFEIISKNDGEEAWKFLQDIETRVSAGEPIDKIINLVITDIEMPRMDGYTLTRNIKNSTVLSLLPVIIFSSIVSQDILHKGTSVGADAQLTKPQIGELLETIRTIMNNKHEKK